MESTPNSKQKIKGRVNTLEDYLLLPPEEKVIKYDSATPIKSTPKEEEEIEPKEKEFQSSITSNNDIPKRLERDFFTQEVVVLSKELLGKIIVRKTSKGETRFRIVETEAYKAPDDKACHAYGNKKTDKTKYFWQIGGCLYVYMIYGHNCVNITAGTAEQPEAVLIRALEPIYNIGIVKDIRKCKKDTDLANGPGKCGASLEITLKDNAVDLCTSDEIYIIEDETKPKIEVEATKRINIDYAEEWVDKLWRFTIKGNKHVSKPSSKKKK